MMNLYELPTVIESCGQFLAIRNRGDWRTIMDVNIALTDIELTDEEKVFAAMTIFYDTPVEEIKDPSDAAQKMVEFLSAGDTEKSSSKSPKLVDWQDDAPIIISAINSVIGEEVRAKEYMHWWTFIAAYMAIGDSTLSTVVSIRDKIARGKKLEKYEQEFRRNNPKYFTRRRDAEAEHNVLLELIE